MDRHIDNTLPDYNSFVAELRKQGEKEDIKYTSSADYSRLCSEVQSWLRENTAHIVRAWPPGDASSPTSVRGYTKRDSSVYVGSGGNAYLHWKLSRFFEAEKKPEKARDHLQKAAESVKVSLSLLPRNPTSNDIAFYIGSAGVHSLAAVVFAKTGDLARAQSHVQEVVGLLPQCLQKSAVDEVLYGRAGYLFCLLFIQKHVGGSVQIKKEVMRRVFDAIMESGKRSSNSRALQFYFYSTDYNGAAHGTAGILYILLQFPTWCREPANDPWIRATLDRFLSFQLPSGNFSTAADSHTDKHIHWCHGAPGSVYTLYQAYQVYGEERYQQALGQALDVIWERGLLRKGFGTCHGIAGSGYAFLLMYRYTGDERLYYSALKMAEFMWSDEASKAVAAWVDPQRHCQGVADFPFSLMEGLAGTICFYCDLLHPENCAFPGYAGDI